MAEMPDTGLDFSDALVRLRLGDKLSRPIWGPGKWVEYVRPIHVSLNGSAHRRVAHLVIVENFQPTPEQTPYQPTQQDLLATDWKLAHVVARASQQDQVNAFRALVAERLGLQASDGFMDKAVMERIDELVALEESYASLDRSRDVYRARAHGVSEYIREVMEQLSNIVSGYERKDD